MGPPPAVPSHPHFNLLRRFATQPEHHGHGIDDLAPARKYLHTGLTMSPVYTRGILG